jgi:hypothetical protein
MTYYNKFILVDYGTTGSVTASNACRMVGFSLGYSVLGDTGKDDL